MTDASSIADAAKAAGNEFFKKGEYEKAVAEFTKAIEADSTNHVLYSNRSGAYAANSSFKEALLDAGINPSGNERKNIACILGIGGGQKASNEFYSRTNYVTVDKVLRKMGMVEKDVDAAVTKFKAQYPEWRLDSFPGFLGNVTAGRCCNVFNLDGMNCVVDAACASSLVALKVAIDDLLSGDVESAVAGACCTDCSIGMYMAFSKTPVFSKAQSVTAYDKGAGGMLIGEGCVMFILKKLENAVKAGDKIHCVINAVASSSDGKAPGIYAPTIEGQKLAYVRAWEKAGLCPSTCTMIEGHGTGTPVGDVENRRLIFKTEGASCVPAPRLTAQSSRPYPS